MPTPSMLFCRFELLLLSFLMAAVLAACSSPVVTPTISPTDDPTAIPASATPTQSASGTVQPSVTPSPTSSLYVDEGKLHGQHIRYWYSGSIEYKNAVEDRVRIFNSSPQIGVWIEPRYFGSWGEMMNELQVTPADQKPHLLLNYPALTGILPEVGLELVDLQPYLQDPIWGFSASDILAFPETLMNRAVSRGVTSFPGYRDTFYLFYNQTWADELGYNQHPPASPKEFQDQACAAAKVNQKSKAPDKVGTGGWIAANSPEVVLSWIAAFGGEDPEGADFRFQNDASRQAFMFLKGMFDQGCAWVARNPDPSGYFANRQALFFSGSSTDIPAVENAFKNRKSEDRWAVIPYPGQHENPVTYGNGPDYFILKSTPEQQLAAWLFLRWMNQADNQAFLAEKSGVVPVRLLGPDEIPASLQQNPGWNDLYKLIEKMHKMPAAPEWVTVGPILQDAAGQLFQTYTKPEQVPSILEMLDRTVKEVVSHNP